MARSASVAGEQASGVNGLVLLYHRIAELQSDPQLLAVTPAHFSQHLEVIRDYGVPMSLTEMLSAFRNRRLPDRAIAVTFDDGYADNLDLGEPLLERHGVPATLFVTTSYMDGEREFWWDDLERLLLCPGRLPGVLRLHIGGTVHEWSLGDAAFYSEDARGRVLDWNVELTEDPSPRHDVYRTLCRLLRTVSDGEREAVLDELSSMAGTTSAGRRTHRPLSRERLARTSAMGLLDVGSHSTSHSTLSALPVSAQRSEIEASRACLQDVTGRDVAGFSYPFGGRTDYTRKTVSLVRDAGFDFACSNMPALVRPRSDRFQLPRVLVRNWDADAFAGRLQKWLGD